MSQRSPSGPIGFRCPWLLAFVCFSFGFLIHMLPLNPFIGEKEKPCSCPDPSSSAFTPLSFFIVGLVIGSVIMDAFRSASFGSIRSSAPFPKPAEAPAEPPASCPKPAEPPAPAPQTAAPQTAAPQRAAPTATPPPPPPPPDTASEPESWTEVPPMDCFEFWIAPNFGQRYHRRRNCPGLENAISTRGLTACKICRRLV